MRYEQRLGVLTIPEFSGSRSDRVDRYFVAAAEIFESERARSSCGWVIDLGNNGGGNPSVMLPAVSPLLDDGVVEQFRTRDGEVSDVRIDGTSVSWDGWRWDRLPIFAGSFGALELRGFPGQASAPTLPGTPAKLRGRPIAIVQSTRSASAAEWVLLAFTGQDDVTTFGSVTRGFPSVNGGFELPDGAMVTLTLFLVGDRDGNFHEGPITPVHAADPEDGSAFAAARDWVLQRCAVEAAQ